MKHFPIVIFLVLLSSSIAVGLDSFWRTEGLIRRHVDNALAMTLAEMSADRVDADTIQNYRNHISIAAVRDTACIAVRTESRNGQNHTVLQADAGCSFATVFSLSDQQISGWLMVMAVLWAVGYLWYRRYHTKMLVPVITSPASYGGLVLSDNDACFYTHDGTQVKLTPMQHKLMEMFFQKENHTLTKQEICDALWPKKPDASDTLYTLIRRLKPMLEASSHLKIESNRGNGYVLIDK